MALVVAPRTSTARGPVRPSAAPERPSEAGLRGVWGRAPSGPGAVGARVQPLEAHQSRRGGSTKARLPLASGAPATSAEGGGTPRVSSFGPRLRSPLSATTTHSWSAHKRFIGKLERK